MYSYDFSDYIGITVSGSDTEDWLNRILSNKVPNDKKYFGASVLDYKANPKMIFFVDKISQNQYLLILEADQKEEALKILEDAIFAEDIELKLLEKIETKVFVTNSNENIEHNDALFSNKKFSLILSKQDPFAGQNYKALNSKEFKNLRKLLGIPGLEIMQKHIIIESDAYLNFVSDDKGCYPGQEVVNKILSIGQVPKKLLVLQSESLISKATEVCFENGKEISDYDSFEFEGQFYFASFVRTKLVQEMSNQISLLVSGQKVQCSQVY